MKQINIFKRLEVDRYLYFRSFLIGGIIIEMTESDLLKLAASMDIIDIEGVREQIEMKKKEELLKNHPYKIWQGADGKWRTYLPDKDKGRKLVKKSTEEDIKKSVVDYWQIELENPTICTVFEEWNDRKLELKKIAPPTHQRNKRIFNRHYNVFGKQRIKTITAESFCEFLEEQIPEHDLTAKAFSNLKTVTRGIIKYARRKKLITFNAEDVFNMLDTSDKDFKKVIKEDEEEVINDEEMDKIMEYLIANKDIQNLGILLMFLTGIRVGELVALKHSDFEDNTFKIRRTESSYEEDGKNIYTIKDYPKTRAGVRTVIIPQTFSWIVPRIRHYSPFSEFVFVKNGRRMTTNTIRRRLEKICKKLNIIKKSPHKIRKTYGTILLDNNIDNNLIIGQMGHTSIVCTENYYHRNRKTIDRKIQVISSIPEFIAK